MKYQVATFQIECEAPLMEAAQDLLADAAAEAGFESFEPTDKGLKAYVQKELFDQEILDKNIEDFDLPDVKITYDIEDVEDQNYNQVWEEQGFEPIVVDDDIIIYDAKHADTFHPGQSEDHIEIGIDAVQAFGTGTHQTTRMIVSSLLHMGVYDKRVLDCGCGTGILGLAASKLGAKDIVGYDIDEWSVENARHNAEINEVENMEIYHGDANVLNHISGIFDVVLANINRNILLNDMPAFKSVMAANATLILSGFYEEDVPMLLEKAAELGLHEKSRQTDEKWTCLILEA